MRQLRGLCLALIALALLVQQSSAQAGGSITGQVTDQATGQPIASAQIFLAGTTRGTLTNQRGQYVLANVPAGAYDVRATLIGFSQGVQRVTVTAGQSVTANFELRQSAIELGAVVATATGQQQRTRELGNSVANIRPADVSMGSVDNVTTLLQSRAPGVTVQGVSGTTGTAPRIRIRGSNSVSLSNEPLVIVDGVRVNVANTDLLSTGGQFASRLDDFDPEQIESIEVLKGPAASALYGTAAANGVIQITTKRGKAGAARWNFYTEHASLRDKTDYPISIGPHVRRGGTGPGQACVVYDIAMQRCPDTGQLKEYSIFDDPQNTPIDNGYRRQYGLSVAGGSEAATYYLSGDWEDENGVLRPSRITGFDPNTLERLNLRANVNARVSDKIDVSARTGYATSKLTLPANDNHLLGVHLNGLLGSGDPNVNFGLYTNASMDQLLANVREQDVRRLTGSVQANYHPLSWLDVTGTIGIDQVNRHDGQYYPGNVLTTFSTLYTRGFRDSYRVETMNVTGTINGSATFSLRPDLISTSSIGGQYNREEYHDTRGGGQGMAPGVTSLQGASQQFYATENTAENATVGAFAQQQFAWKDRVYLTGAVRGDDNSAFGSKIGFVTYPSVSASWVVSEEGFFPDVPVLSSLRLRGAWGKSGLRPSFRDAITVYEPVSVRIEGREASGFTLRGTGSAELRPEIAREYEFGFDAGLFGDRIALELTRYDKLSKDALVRRTLPPSLGLTASAFANIGSVSNKGWEAALRGVLLERDNYRWDFSLTGARTKNRLEKLASDIPFVPVSTGRNRQEHRERYPLGGYWQRAVTFQDLNGDNLIQYNRTTCPARPAGQREQIMPDCEVAITDSVMYLGQPFPGREAAFNTTLTLFKLVRISALLDHKGDFKQRNFTRFDRCSWEQLCEETYRVDKTTLRDQAAWIAYNILEPNTNTALYLEDGDFIKLREVSVSLEAPASLVSRYGLGAQGVRLTLSGRNLKTWTDYTGIDPEINQFGMSNFATQEYYTQPPIRYYTARIDINF